MPLVSHLFKHDPVFERCLTQDASHIMPGSHGPHVNKIQTALRKLDKYAVAESEIHSQTYGPSTTAGVLAYKQKRRIINRTYQSQPDSIVGKMTIASLDAEMARVEPHPGPSVKINCFPPQHYPSYGAESVNAGLPIAHTLLAFNITAASVAPVIATAAAPPAVTPDSLLEQARIALPTAIAWCTAALTKLKEVRGKIEKFHVYTREEIKSFEPIEIHFKVRIPTVEASVATDRIDKIITLYKAILTAFGRGMAIFRGDPANPNKATAPLGGFARGELITIGNDFAKANPNMRAAVLVHEGAHFVDNNCSHAASEQPSPDGSAITDEWGVVVNPTGKNYAQLNFDLSIRNAYSVAQCALHNGLGTDKRPP